MKHSISKLNAALYACNYMEGRCSRTFFRRQVSCLLRLSTEIELNFAVVKIKHKVIKKK